MAGDTAAACSRGLQPTNPAGAGPAGSLPGGSDIRRGGEQASRRRRKPRRPGCPPSRPTRTRWTPRQARKEFEAEHEKKAKEAADPLSAAYRNQVLLGNKPDSDWVAKQLQQTQGMGKKEAESIAGDVATNLAEALEKEVAKVAAEKGTTKQGALFEMRKDRMEQLRDYQMQMVEANLGIGMAQGNAMQKLWAPIEHIAAQDFARKAEASGGGFLKDQLEVMRANLELQRSWDRYIKLLGNPPKLGR